ncbi:hypothetical protein PVAG01_02025 [Phlyctema vagabunda]|uniref:Uncharacterized protein n=1 Tax=Phlyctema vagabunda TaxID=108571 RepID=A0ABR4PZ08_9HELO
MPSRVTSNQQVLYGFAGVEVVDKFKCTTQTLNEQNQIVLDHLKVHLDMRKEQERVQLLALLDQDLARSKAKSQSSRCSSSSKAASAGRDTKRAPGNDTSEAETHPNTDMNTDMNMDDDFTERFRAIELADQHRAAAQLDAHMVRIFGTGVDDPAPCRVYTAPARFEELDMGDEDEQQSATRRRRPGNWVERNWRAARAAWRDVFRGVRR